MTPIRVRLFAALREEAGTGSSEASGSTAGEVVDALAERFGERFARIAGVGTIVVNGERADRDTRVKDGDEVAILPPVAGGSGRSRSLDSVPARWTNPSGGARWPIG